MTNSFTTLTDDAPSESLHQNQINQMSNLYAKATVSHQILTSILGLGETITGSTFSPKEVVAVSLSQMQKTDCMKCLYSRIGIAKILGFSEQEIKEIRHNKVTDAKLSGLIAVAHELKDTNFKPHRTKLKKFYIQGYSKDQLCDLIGLIALNHCNHETDCAPDCRDIIDAA